MRNLILDHVNSMIFQRNYLFRIIRYDTQAIYRDIALRENLIVVSHRMSRMIDSRRFRESFLQQLQHLRQDASIQELCEHQQDLYEQIRKNFEFIYRAINQSIYDEYQQVKRDIDRLLKEKERALKTQLHENYDAIVSMQDMLAQLTINDLILFLVQSRLVSIKYVFEKRARIFQVFFDLSSFVKCDEKLNRQIFIVDDLISLCNRQERRSRKSRSS